MSKCDLESPFRPILLRSWHAGNECQEGLECLVVISVLKMVRILHVALADMMWLFMLSSNRAKKWFNAIFDSKLTPEYSYKMIFLKREIRKTFCWKISDRIFIKKFRDHSCDCWFVIVNINLGSFSANLVSIPFIEKWIFCPKWTK